ncbi:MAG: PBP1A family penicillin-binding protein [Pseudomonadales bacterium]|nr:PBP1A family penicillin-binding protein [Pseudomonadales bacterium]
MPAYLRSLAVLATTLTAGLVMGLAGTYLYLDPQLPKASSYRDLRLQSPLRVFSADGAFIAEFGDRRRMLLDLEDMPPLYVQAVLNTEDKRFYSHRGVDFVTLAKAIGRLLVRGVDGPGGSTITMQLARNVSLSFEKTILRKAKEIFLALKLEREFTKDEILELYLNAVFFGKRAYGSEAAAQTYYGKPLGELSTAQLAMLAGVMQRPSGNNPINDPEGALRRRNLILFNMFEQGSIDRAEYDTARAEPVTASLHERQPELDAPWVAEWARQQALELYGDGAYEDGLAVYTTVETAIQARANVAVIEGLDAYDRRHGYRGPERILPAPEDGEPVDEATREGWLETLAELRTIGDQVPAVVTRVDEEGFDAVFADGAEVRVPLALLRWAREFRSVEVRGPQPERPADVVAPGHLVRLRRSSDGWGLGQVPEVQGAVIALAPRDGAVRALVGGYDFGRLQFNHALQAERQPGSGFKPFMYAAAIDAGRTPATIYQDAPLVFEDENLEGLYRPKNDSGAFGGPTRLRTALYRSINLVSMRVLLDLGASNVINYVTRFGFDTRAFPRNLQLAIGGGTMAVAPMDMARAYTVFANGGFAVEPYLIERIELQGEGTIYSAQPTEACDSTCEADRDLELLLAEEAGEPLPEAPQPAPRVLDERTAYIMNSMLGDVVRYGTARRARSLEREDIGGKTGTTNAADVWFSGFQRELAATVWVGFNDNRPLGSGEFGSNLALPIWIDLMETALAGAPTFVATQPPGVVRMRIDPATGRAASATDEEAIFELFLAEHAPTPAVQQEQDASVRPEEIF